MVALRDEGELIGYLLLCQDLVQTKMRYSIS